MIHKIKTLDTKDQNKTFYNAGEAKLKNELGICLKTARINLHLQQRNVVEQLKQYGISISAGALSKWENGDAMPNPYQLFAICCVYGIDDILLHFTGHSGRKLNSIGRRKVQEYEQDLLATGLYSIAEEPSENRPRNPFQSARPALDGMIHMPVSLLKTSAGYGSFLDEDHFEDITVPASSVPSGAAFGVYVSGDSMEPRYKDGELVWVQPCEQLHPHEIGIFICDGEGFIKMYDEISPSLSQLDEYTDSSGDLHMQPVLVSLNTRYSPRVIDPSCDFRVVGRVLN